MHLSEARQTENEDVTDEELPSTSGRPFGEVFLSQCYNSFMYLCLLISFTAMSFS